jgi:PAS domain S-box-containing protein
MSDTPSPSNDPFVQSLIDNGGKMGRRMAAFDWSNTSIGPIATWSQSLRTAVGLLMRSPMALVMLWNEDGVMLYNDAYSVFAGNRHPQLLGSKVREGWPEVADFNDNIMKVCLAGGTLAYRDHVLSLNRTGTFEEVFLDLDYSPVPDDNGRPAGVIAFVVEITQRVLAERRERAERERFLQLFEQAPSFMAVLSGPTHRFAYVNPRYKRLIGGRDVVGQDIADALPEVIEQGFVALLDQVYGTGEPFTALGVKVLLRNTAGEPVETYYLDFVYQPMRDVDGTVTGIFVEGSDVTESKLGETRMQALVRLSDVIRDLSDPAEISYQAARVLGETMQVSRAGYGLIDTESETITIERDWNAPGITTIAGTLRFRDYGSYIEDLKRGETAVVADAYKDPRTVATADALKAISAQAFVNMPVTERGRSVALLYLNHETVREWSEADMALIAEFADRTRAAVERARSEIQLREANESLESKVEARTHELMQMEQALRQSQKMEAIGQLTGGIAHDFNNMLAVVMGSLDLLGRRIGDMDARAKRYADAAMEGAKRAASLTQRLLAFSRQQPLQPESLDPNRLVAGMSDMLRHSIGADIRLETVLTAGPWRIHVDPNQLESVILNLAVNARDAMPKGGRLTIETQNTHLDARYVAAEMGVPAGQYVLIAVTDTGDGMTADVIAKAFDPFFTTKDIGRGTGLGLSQVYGFVKQSGGHVKIYSEPGQGTTVKIYLPRGTEHDAGLTDDAGVVEILPGEAREVVLVVDDEPTVRQFSVDALTELGYGVLEADSAAAALRLLQAHPEIALLFTDIVMPDTNGRQLADAARQVRPALKVLYTTGYTRNAVVHNGVVDAGVELIGKPFTIDELAARLRACLDGV